MRELIMSDDAREVIGLTNKRKGKLSQLMELDDWDTILANYLLAIAFGSSIVSASAQLGVSPSTLNRWLNRGRNEQQGEYRELWDRTQIAIGQAVSNAEQKLYETDPKWYLTRGPGRLLVGDIYNVESGGEASYGIDGTVGDDGSVVKIGSDNEDNVQAIDIPNATDDNRDETVAAALIGLEESGINIETLLKHYINKHNKTIGDNSIIE
jgi:hypothetical protein